MSGYFGSLHHDPKSKILCVRNTKFARFQREIRCLDYRSAQRAPDLGGYKTRPYILGVS